MNSDLVVTSENLLSTEANHYNHLIRESWNKTIDGILETASYVNEAFTKLEPKDWKELKEELPFRDSVCSMMLTIGKSDRFLPGVKEKLPPNYNIIYEFSQLDEPEWKQALDEGILDTDISTTEMRNWKNNIRFGDVVRRPNQPRTPNIDYFALIQNIEDCDVKVQEEVKQLLFSLEVKLQALGVGVLYKKDMKTQRVQSLEERRNELREKLEQELEEELKEFNQVSRRELDVIEDTYYQHRNHQHHGKYPFSKTAKNSIEGKEHPYSLDKMDFKKFRDTIRKKKIITQWTPIREWSDLGKGKCIKLALEHTNAGTSTQRGNYKKQLKNIVSRGLENSSHAETYLKMLIEDKTR